VNSINYLTEGHLLRWLISISLPIIAGNLLQSVLEGVDLYFMGRTGANAIAGVAISSTIIFVLATFIVVLVTTTTAFISRHYSAQEHDAVGLIVQHAVYIGLAFFLAISVYGLFFSKDLLKLLGTNETIATLGSTYRSVLFLGIFTMIELWVVMSSFQACGNSTTPMILMVGVNIENIILNPVLIFGVAGFPAFSIAGYALATILSRGAGFVIGMLLLVRYSRHITFPKTWSLDLPLI
jgi:putative MATE family efflux protein